MLLLDQSKREPDRPRKLAADEGVQTNSGRQGVFVNLSIIYGYFTSARNVFNRREPEIECREKRTHQERCKRRDSNRCRYGGSPNDFLHMFCIYGFHVYPFDQQKNLVKPQKAEKRKSLK